MATQVLGNHYGRGTGLRVADYFYYTASSTETTYTLTLYSGVKFMNRSGLTATWDATTTTLIGSGKTAKSGSVAAWSQAAGGTTDKTAAASFSWSWPKTTYAQTITITAYSTSPTSGFSYKASKSFTIPALKSYTISYNANGGSGAPSSQTKYYDQTLTITASKPTRSGYTFKGWATSSSGQAVYRKGTNNTEGTSYTANASQTLYAVWELNYVKPKITNVSVERCDSTGDLNVEDENAKYAKVSFDWSIDVAKYPSNAVDSLSVTVGSFTESVTAAGSSNHEDVVVGDGTFDTDEEYPATIVISDTSGQTGSTVTVVNTLGRVKFPLDISEDGDSMGLMMPAIDGHSVSVPDLYARGHGNNIILVENGTTSEDCGIMATRTDTGSSVWLGIGSGGINHGVYSPNINRWLIYGTYSNNDPTDNPRTIVPYLYPVNSVFITATNTNPSTMLGYGTWSLIDKDFKYQWITSGFTFNTTNTTDGSYAACLNGKTIEFRLTWHNKTALSDSDVTIGTLTRSSVGISAGHMCYPVAYNDGCNAIGQMHFDLANASAVLGSYDWVTRATSYPTTTDGTAFLSFTYVVHSPSNMTDSFCDKFYWKRTA